MQEAKTLIPLLKTTKKRLKKACDFEGRTYDRFINLLLDVYDKNFFKEYDKDLVKKYEDDCQ